jgi:predicted dehydrogenase
MPGDTIGVGFIGAGWISRTHAHALSTLNHVKPLAKRIRLVSIAGRRPERVAALAAELGFDRWTTRWQDVVEDDDVDVVANLAANEVHAPGSIAALEAGKPVLCEKPLGRDSTEALAMLEAAERAAVQTACGFNYRYVPAVRLARELVAAGKLGSVRHYRGLYLQDWLTAGDTRPSHGGAGAVLDYAHLADMVRYLAGDPLAVTARLTHFVSPREDAFVAACELPGRAIASLEASRCATGWKGFHRVEVNGANGSVWWDMEDLNRLHVFLVEDEREGLGGFRDVLVTQPDHPFLDQWWTPGHVLGWDVSFVHEWRDFLEAVLENRPVSRLQASFKDGYEASVLCDAIIASSEQGRRVEVAETKAIATPRREEWDE